MLVFAPSKAYTAAGLPFNSGYFSSNKAVQPETTAVEIDVPVYDPLNPGISTSIPIAVIFGLVGPSTVTHEDSPVGLNMLLQSPIVKTL